MRIYALLVLTLLFTVSIGITGVLAQQPTPESIEVSDRDGIPVILKHLPDWENKKSSAVFIKNLDKLRETLGDRAVFAQLEFYADTEAATAEYEEGKLLIVEYGTPQASVYTDNKIRSFLETNPQQPPVYYRRIGNYSAFVFDSASAADAEVLLGQVKFEKVIRWLSYDPFAQQRAERNFINETRDLFIATVLVILSGFGVAALLGLVCGVVFYQIRLRQRATTPMYSDGGGLTRLNLDQLTPDTGGSALLED